jgi:hypothetical protein
MASYNGVEFRLVLIATSECPENLGAPVIELGHQRRIQSIFLNAY